MGYAVLSSNRVIQVVPEGLPTEPALPPIGYVLLGDDKAEWPSIGDRWLGDTAFVTDEPTPVPALPSFDLVITDIETSGVDPKLVFKRGPRDVRAPKGVTFTPIGSIQKDGVILTNFTGEFVMPVEKRGGSPVPVFVFVDKGIVTNTTWTPGAPGFYLVTEAGVNSELHDFRLNFTGLRLDVSEA